MKLEQKKCHDERMGCTCSWWQKVEEPFKGNEGVVRNKLKTNAVNTNAKEYFKLCWRVWFIR